MQVNVTFRKTSRMSLRVTSKGAVNVSAPYGTSRKVISDFVESHRDWIRDALARNADRQRRRLDFYSMLPLDTKEQREEAVRRLDALILPMVRKYVPLMGVPMPAVEYKALISRWGCCNPRLRRVTFSAYLLLLPEWCAEHVVVHELAHFLVPDHSARFHAVMDRWFPRWREARKVTRECMGRDDDDED